MASYDLTVPISEKEARALQVGDTVRLSGILVTARDAAHRYLVETLMQGRSSGSLSEADLALYQSLRTLLHDGLIYHCGPIVRRAGKSWEFVATGPTTSSRLEQYEPEVISHFGLRGVIGKGGMGAETLAALEKQGAAYFHVVGGAAALVARRVQEVLAVHKRAEMGVPEAMWVVRVAAVPAVVTMDSHGRSLHSKVERASAAALERLLKQ